MKCEYTADGKCTRSCYYYDERTGKCFAFTKGGEKV